MANDIDDINAQLSQTGAPAFPYEAYDDTCDGILNDYYMRQTFIYQTTTLDFWPDGNPKMELVLVVDIGETGDHDTTERRLFAKKGGAMWKALQEALRESGAPLERGGRIKMRYTEDGTPKVKGHKPPKQYKAKWTPPAKVAPSVADLDDL